MRHKILTDLISLKGIFDKVEVPFFMQEGNALGYGRYQDIMEWDTDIDIGVSVEVNNKDRRYLFKDLRLEGWYNASDSGDFVYAVRNVKLNIWFYHLESGYYVARPDSTPGEKFVWPREFYDQPKGAMLYGMRFLVPNNLEKYLSWRYGQDWKDNIQKDDHIWKQSEPFVFKWQHKMKEGLNPEEVNREWLSHIG